MRLSALGLALIVLAFATPVPAQQTSRSPLDDLDMGIVLPVGAAAVILFLVAAWLLLGRNTEGYRHFAQSEAGFCRLIKAIARVATRMFTSFGALGLSG